MKLLYSWIKEFKNIKHQGFHLCQQFIFDVHVDGSTINIDSRKNEEYANIFEGQILNVSALIGENGSGKSNFLEAFREGYHSIDIYILDNGKLFVSFDSDYFGNYTININQPDLFSEENIDIYRPETIFYSSIVDLRYFPSTNLPQDIDISTNYLLDDDKQKNNGGKDFDILQVHRYTNIKRQLVFLNTTLKDEINDVFSINYPSKVEIIATYFSNEELDRGWNLDNNSKRVWDILSEKLLEKTTTLSDIEHDRNRPIEERNIALVDRCHYLFLRGIIGSFFHSRNNSNLFLNTELGIDLTVLAEKEIYGSLIYFANNQNWISGNVIEDLILHVSFIFEYISIPNESLSEDVFNKVTVPIDNAITLLDLQKAYLKEISNINGYSNGPFDFNCRDLSSGEKAILDIFSRFYYAKDRTIEKQLATSFYQEQNTLISIFYILIDEGDICLHPEWQKRYLDILINFLPLCLKDETRFPDPKFYIILSSHSPFLVSDLPKTNIIFLKNQDNECVVEENPMREENSFGANIHQLFSNSFFMNGFIGTFAKKTIDKLIKEILDIETNGSLMDKGFHDNLKKRIDIIGEPIIKEKLLQKLDLLKVRE